MSAIDDIHAKLRAGGQIDANEAVLYAQLTNELAELLRIVNSLRGIAADAVADEREACAKIADNGMLVLLDGGAERIAAAAAAIRNRT